jgi:N-acetyl-anhydromuramyl-L-alanine amidase AmpD
MTSFNFFTAFQNALSNPSAYSSFQKEMNLKAVEQVFFNSLSGKTSFMAVVLTNTGDIGTKSDGFKSIRVRPLNIHDFIIPEPCAFSAPEARKRVIALHPVAYPDSNWKFTGGNDQSADSLTFGNIVECFFGDGPQGGGRLRGLNYRPKIISGTSNLNLECLQGVEVEGEAKKAFDEGNVVPMDEFTGPPLPTSSIAQDLRDENKYSVPASGPKVMDPKHIVIHYGTSRNALGDQKYAAALGKGYHYAVTRSGEVYYFNDNKKRIIHASDRYFNDNSIAINFENVGYEREGFPAESDWIEAQNKYSKHKGKWQPYTNEQYQNGSQLIADICKELKLDPTGTTNGYPTIVGHDYVTVEVAKLNKTKPSKVKSDPGPAFKIEGIRALAKSKM